MLKTLLLVVALAIVLMTMHVGSGREGRHRRRLEGDGRRQPADDRVLGQRLRLRAGPGLQPELAMAAIRQPELQARDRLPGRPRRAWTASGSRARTRRAAAASSRSAASSRRPDDHRGRNTPGVPTPMGAAARDLDDAVRLPQSRGDEQRDDARADDRRAEVSRSVTFTGQNKAKVNGYINAQNMVEKVETWIDDALLGDLPFDAVYSDYKDFGGVKFPTRIIQNQGGYPIFDLRISDVKPNAPVTIQATGGGAAARGERRPRRRRLTAVLWADRCEGREEQRGGRARRSSVSRGVYLVGGYSGAVVDFKPYIVVIEGGQSEERSNAVIAAAKKLIPKKRIRYVVNTHHHIDHSRGLRRYVAEGDHRHPPDQRAVLRTGLRRAEDAESRCAVEGEEGADVRDADDEEGDDRWQPRHRAASHGGQRSQRRAAPRVSPEAEDLVEADAYNPPAQTERAGADAGQPVHGEPGRDDRSTQARCRNDRADSPAGGWTQSHARRTDAHGRPIDVVSGSSA